MVLSLSGYPSWFVIALATVAAAAVLWLLAHLLKAGLILLTYAVILFGVVAVVWAILR